jgi:hypothetical protein
MSDVNAPHFVVIEPAERAGLVFPLDKAQLVIGHSDSADLVVDDEFVSGRHALVAVDAAGRVTIWDLNSTGGTFVNDARLTGSRVLEPGDLVRMADLSARFEPGGETANTDATDAAVEAPRPSLVTADALAYTVNGVVTSPVLPPFGGLAVQLVDKNVGGDEVLTSTLTGSDGHYSIGPVTVTTEYLQAHHKALADLQVLVSAGDGVLASSAVVYSAPPSVTLDVELPASARGLPSEYEILIANLAAVYPGSLRTLREDDSHQDFTYLASKTGWDADTVALATLADQFGQLTARAPTTVTDPGRTAGWPVPVVSLRPEFYYALFRAGLPASADALFRTSPAGVQAVWEQATSQGIIPAPLADEISQALQTFQTLSAANLLTAAPAAGISTLDEMLRPVLPETAQREAFARLYVRHQGDWPAFWTAVEEQAGAAATGQLKLLGQLYHLTVNNEPLVTALLAAEADPPIQSTADLARRGYYDPARWAPLIGSTVPPLVPGGDTDERAASYARRLAAQVRLSFPTPVVASQILTRAIPVVGDANTADQVGAFLNSPDHASFDIGAEPVQAYLARTGQADVPAEVIAQVSRIQRVYQMTPDDSSMAVLLRHNLDSAFAVTRFDAAGFTRAFAGKLGGADVAAAVHARARQIFASTLAVTAAYLGGRISPTLGGRNPFLPGFPPMTSAPTYPVVAYPTLENLFGSLDYCDCQDCGSILSPAAYLVDLLHYLDQPAPTGGLANPQDVLLGTDSLPGRRPDLQYLPLTCANTNTALPYIDLVNETLEYFVANGLTLDGYQGHDTGDAITSAELVASPQYVDDAAYATLEQAFFPPPLPFSRPLLLLRLHLAKLGLTLPDAMTALRADDQLINAGTPVSYGWFDILIERLGIARDEYLLFADLSLSLGDLWGLPDTAPPGDPPPPSPLSVLQTMSLAEFSRRLDLSYDDLSAIIQTEYINPNAALIPRLARLNAPFATLKALHDDPASNAVGFIDALPAGLDATEYGGTSPTDYNAVVTWVTDPVRYPLIMDIITITAPAGSAGDCSGVDLQFRYSNPDVSTNALSTDDFTRLIRFIRLWQKLSPLIGDASDAASIQHTDAVLSALSPLTPPPPGPIPVPPAMLRLGFLFQFIDLLGLSGDSLDQVLACWAPIGATGASSLYARMFLTPTLLQQDPGAQIATVGPVNQGDVLVTTINGQQVSSYTVAASDTPATTAAAITEEINAAVVADPASGLPVNCRFGAAATVNAVSVKAGFTLACGPADAYTAATTSPVEQTATVTDPVTAGDTLTTTIDTIAIEYTVQAGDTPATVAAAIAAVVNATTIQDPYSGLALNDLVVASSTGNIVSLIGAGAGAPFSLGCDITPAHAGSYTAAPPTPAGQQVTITAAAVAQGDAVVVTINHAAVTYAAPAAMDVATFATKIAAAVSASVAVDGNTADGDTGLPVNDIVKATSADNVITFTAVDPASQFTLACTPSAGTETYSAPAVAPETAAATVTGPIPAGATLTTTINNVPLVRMAGQNDTPATLAAGIARDINAATTIDTATGQPVNFVVSAAAAGPVVTITGRVTTTPFTLSAALSPSQYTAGRDAAPFADDGYGDFLADASQTLFAHQPTICAACNLSGAEFTLIAAELGFVPATPLTLPNVSAVFRFGWLAHTLGLSILEFLRLREFTGLDPFWPLDPREVTPVEPPAIRFLRLLSAISGSGLSTVQALYLMWNQDISGTSAPPLSGVTGLASALRGDFAAVEAQFTLRDDPDGKIAQSLMTLVYGATATGFFFGLLNNTVTASVTCSGPPGLPALPAPALPPPVVAAANGQLSYSDLSKQLSYAGYLDPATLTVIDAAIANDPALSTALAALAAESQQASAPFFATYPELKPLYTAYAASADPVQAKRTTLLDGFLPILTAKRKVEQALADVTAAAGTDPSFAATLLQDPGVLHADSDVTAPAINDLTAIETQGLTASFFFSNDPGGVADQVTAAVPTLNYAPTATPLPPNPGGGPLAGTWTGYITVPQDGFYDVSVAADPSAGITLIIGNVTVIGVVTDGTWQNQSPISLVAGRLTPIALTVTSLETTLSVSWQSTGLGWQIIPGQYLYSASLVSRLNNTYLRFLKAASLATALSLTAPELPYLAVSPTGGAWLNLLASTPDAATSAMLRDVLTDLLDFSRIKLALSAADERLLAVVQNPSALLPTGQSALLSLTGWSQESLYALLTRFFGTADPTMIGSVRNFSRVYDAYAVVRACGLPAGTLISAITNAPTAATLSTLESALRARYADPDWLTAVQPINDTARVQQRDALVAYILQQLGDRYAQSVITLTTSTDTAIGATTLGCKNVTGVTAGMLVNGAAIAPGAVVTAVAADPADPAGTITLSVATLAAMPAKTTLSAAPYATTFESADSLYEYLLVDVQTQPPVLTSRIRLALSEVQLFTERVIRNLEPQVSAADIDVGRWEWMKRYRLWQANREVFLWPENWLYPELRDDQSPFFQQMMSTLLQGDITDDAAASGYLDYLTSLEEVAKLEPCGLYYQRGSADTDEVSYVVARTAGAHRKHYFRQLVGGSWTPWTEVMIDCEDMPLTPVVWNGRLFLFWLKVIKQGRPTPSAITSSGGGTTNLAALTLDDLNASVTRNIGTAANSTAVQGVLCWTEYYNGKWQPTKTSDINRPTTIGTFSPAGSGSFDEKRNQFRLIPAPLTGSNPTIASGNVQFSLPSDALVLAITAGSLSFIDPNDRPDGYGGFVLHNTHSLPIRFDDLELPGPDGTTVQFLDILDIPTIIRGFIPYVEPYTGAFSQSDFVIWYQESVSGNVFGNDLFIFSWPPRVIHPQNAPSIWTSPFLYEDRRNLFYVTTTISQLQTASAQGFGVIAATPVLPSAATNGWKGH